MITTKQLPMIVLFFAFILLLFLILSYLTDSDTVDIDSASQVSSVDFDRYIAILSTDCYERYPSQLYTPEDFASGEIKREPSPDKPVMEQGYGTYRIVLELPPGKVYGLSAYTATYAQKLWIDGVLVSQVGEPGGSAEAYTPKTGYFTVYFTAGETTEIVIQRASFGHARGGQHGKGFAVVAEEVRNLAAKSAEEKAELGVSIAGETAASLMEIVTGISESAATSEEMSGQADMLESLISQFKLKDGGANSYKSLPSSGRAYQRNFSTPDTSFKTNNDGFGKY